jgi:hypothetical protein
LPGTPAAIKRTLIRFAIGGDTTFDASTVFTYVKARELGSFTKNLAGTAIRLTLTDNASQIGNAGTGVCRWQLRIDGKNSAGATTDHDGTEAINGAVTTVPIPVVSVFGGLGAGSHTVSLWVWTNNATTTCRDNGGNHSQSVLAEEVN